MDVIQQTNTQNSCQDVLRRLKRHARILSRTRIQDLLVEDTARVQDFCAKLPYLHFQYANQNIDRKAMHWLKAYAQAVDVTSAFERLHTGALVNDTECLPALHHLHRTTVNDAVDTSVQQAFEAVQAANHQTMLFVERIIQQKMSIQIRQIVHIGVGGSYLGPKILHDALAHQHKTGIDIQFVANLDEQDFLQTVQDYDPHTTFFVIASKSWRTKETIKNFRRAQTWLNAQGCAWKDHCLAVTAHLDRAQEMGFYQEHILPMMAWVGGRYSIWSAVSVGVACAIGSDAFQRFLAGGRAVDQALRTTALLDSIPMAQALLNFWHTTICQVPVRAVLPYAYGLRDFSDFVQQLDMESLGKTHHHHPALADLPIGTVILGGEETNAQHAYHQLLHQGCYDIPIEFVLPVGAAHKMMMAEALGQSAVYLTGMDLGPDDPKSIPGNRPSSMLLMQGLTPESLGALIATYEYQVFFSSVLWGINPFDQFGVEHGKVTATQMMHALEGRTHKDLDKTSDALIQVIQQWMETDG